MNNYLEEEKKQTKDTRFRMMQLNTNDRKRRLHYTFILLIWVGAFILIMFLIFACKFLPSWMPCKLIIALIFLTAMGASLYLYYDLQKRDPMDYDRLNLGPPDFAQPPTNTKMSENDFAAFTLGFCTSASCCSTGTKWDDVNKKCIGYRSSEFNHLTFAGCILWLDSNDTDSIKKNVDTNAISQWDDKSGNHYHFLQSVANNQPIHTVKTLNEKPVIVFQAQKSNYMMGNSTSKMFSVQNNSFAYFIVCKVVNNGGILNKALVTENNGTNPGNIFCTRFGNKLNMAIMHEKEDNYIQPIDDSTNDNGYRILSIVCNRKGGVDTAYCNGLVVGTTLTYNPDSYSHLPNTSNFFLGAASKNNNDNEIDLYLEGGIAEVLCYSNSSDLDTNVRQKIEGYLAWKWGLQGKLQTNHPYKNVGPLFA